MPRRVAETADPLMNPTGNPASRASLADSASKQVGAISNWFAFNNRFSSFAVDIVQSPSVPFLPSAYTQGRRTASFFQ